MQKNYGWWLPADISTHGWAIDRLIIVVHVFMAVLFVGWMLFLLLALFRFRARPGQAAVYHGKHYKLPTYLEVGVALFEAVLLFIFSIPLFYRVKQELPPEERSLKVHVVAEQFAWNVHYPGQDGRFGRTDLKFMSPSNPLGLDPQDPAGRDDITTINQLRVPEHRPIIVELTSKDVIHCFTVPVMRVKQDVIPGERIPVWFEATRTGQFEIACAQLCGLGHYRMRGFFVVDTPDKFQAWLEAETARKLGAPKPLLAVPAAAAPAP